jgi:hypothetical protein
MDVDLDQVLSLVNELREILDKIDAETKAFKEAQRLG